MQISASNLLTASQVTQAPAQQPNFVASFAAALKANPADAKPAFEELPLRKAEAPTAGDGESKPAATAPTSRPGANLDIRI
jgi:hypothetical protein